MALRFACAATLALAISAGALAQDEMPKDQTPAIRKAPAPAAAPPAPPPGDEAAPPPGTMIDEQAAVLQALDKVTARVRRIAVTVGQAATFGTLTIKLDACRKAPPEDTPESAAFLEIRDRNAPPPRSGAETAEQGSSGDPHTVFSGWMFASSPALSAMDHPVYDISVVDCASEATAMAESSAPSPSKSPAR